MELPMSPWTRLLYALLIICFALGALSGCEMPLGSIDEGRLVLTLKSDMISNDLLDWMPQTDTSVSSVNVTLTGPEGTVREAKGDGITPFMFEGLSTGEWNIEAEAENAAGEQIAYIYEQGEYRKTVRVARAQTVQVEASLVLIREGSGSLEVAVDWKDLDLGAYGDTLKVYLSVSQAEGDTTLEKVVDHHGTSTVSHTFSDLVPGEYQVAVAISDDPEHEAFWEHTYSALVVSSTLPTRGVIHITEYPEGYGDIELIITDPDQTEAAPFTQDSFPLITDDGYAEVTFTSTGSYTNPVYEWYINGNTLETSDTFTHQFESSGQYSVVLSVQELHDSSDVKLYSTELALFVFDQLPLKGETGPGGGYIFYDKGSFSDGWRFLEAAPEDVRYPQTSTFVWSNVSDGLLNTESNIGLGRNNTQSIIAQSGHEISAALLASSYTTRGYEDWFLPSYDELFEMYTILYQHSLGQFGDGYYWSSTSIGENDAWRLRLSSGTWYKVRRDGFFGRIRTVRAF